MTISERTSNDVTIIDVEGAIYWPEGSRTLRQHIENLFEAGRTKIVVNLGDVNYVDSSALGELIRLHIKVQGQYYGDLKILHPAKMITDLLTITRLIQVFEIFDEEEAAVRSFELLTKRKEVTYRVQAIHP